MAALVKEDWDNWVRRSIPWTIFGVISLGTGLVLGGYWAYKTLGWGGYWGWDPVENASLVPWLATAALTRISSLSALVAAAASTIHGHTRRRALPPRVASSGTNMIAQSTTKAPKAATLVTVPSSTNPVAGLNAALVAAGFVDDTNAPTVQAALNGGLNFSILDGWWAEAYDGSNGFAIGHGTSHVSDEITDARDAEALYRTLEDRVIPTYYDRDVDGLGALRIEQDVSAPLGLDLEQPARPDGARHEAPSRTAGQVV